MRCNRCGSEPRFTVEDQHPTHTPIRFYAQAWCCGLTADDSGPTAEIAVERMAATWARRHPEPPGDLSAFSAGLHCPRCAKAVSVDLSLRADHFANRWQAVVECKTCAIGAGSVAMVACKAAEEATQEWRRVCAVYGQVKGCNDDRLEPSF